MQASFTKALLASVALLQLIEAKMTTASYFYRTDRPLLHAHRGNAGEYPELSQGAFETTYETGADFMEIDLVMTSDGVLVAFHDLSLNATTDIADYASQFKDRRRFGGSYLVADFTVAELKQLRLKQRYRDRPTDYNGLYEIMTFQEVIDLALTANSQPRTKNSERKMGLNLDLKKPTETSTKTGYDYVQTLLDTLNSNGVGTIADCENTLPIIIETYDDEALQRIAATTDLPLVQDADLFTVQNWEHIATYASGIGAENFYVMNDRATTLLRYYWTKWNVNKNTYSAFIEKMHGLDMSVFPFGMTLDRLDYTRTQADEIELYVTKGIDGIFADYPEPVYDFLEAFGSQSGFPA